MSAWNMNTSKGRPGGQGSLFSVGDKDSVLNPKRRWPRGYSPERQAEVSQALDLYTNVRPTARVDPPRRATEVRARLQDAIARSTVPAEHLAGLQEVHDQPAPGTKATYWPGRKQMAVNMFEEDGDKNLIHELGHHHDTANKVTAGIVNSDDEMRKKVTYAPSNNGTNGFGQAAEAVADEYYVEHYRGPGRTGARATQGRYEDTGLADNMEGYRAVRPAKILGPQWAEERPLFTRREGEGKGLF